MSTLSFISSVNKVGHNYYTSRAALFSKIGKIKCNYILSILNNYYSNIEVKSENDYAHSILINNPRYIPTTVDKNKLIKKNHSMKNDIYLGKENDIDKMDFKNLKDVLKYIKYCNKIKENNRFIIFKYLIQNIQNLNNNDFLRFLLTMASVSFPCKDKRDSVYNLLSRHCIHQSKWWNINQLLLVGDIWYALDNQISFNFYGVLVKRIYDEIESLDPYKFTQYFFFVNLYRHFQFHTKQSNIEEKFEEILDHLSIEEVGIICMGYFKSKNIIKQSSLLRNITKKLLLEKKKISDFTLCSILKLLKISFSGSSEICVELVSSIQREFFLEIQRLNHYSLINLVSIGNHISFYDEELLNQIINKLNEDITSLRLKDMERIAYILMNVQLNSESSDTLCKSIEKQLLTCKRNTEIISYPYAFLSCVYYLTCLKYVNLNLISKALLLNDPSAVSNKKKPERFRQMYELHLLMQIEYQDIYEGHKLSNLLCKELKECMIEEWESGKLSKHTKQEKIFLELQNMVSNIFGENYWKTAHTVPISFLPDVIFCTDQHKNVIPFPHNEYAVFQEELQPQINTKKNINWNVLVLVGDGTFLHNSKKLRGSMQLKMQLLKRLGYEIILIHQNLLNKKSGDPTFQVIHCLASHVNTEWQKKLKNNVLGEL